MLAVVAQHAQTLDLVVTISGLLVMDGWGSDVHQELSMGDFESQIARQARTMLSQFDQEGRKDQQMQKAVSSVL